MKKTHSIQEIHQVINTGSKVIFIKKGEQLNPVYTLSDEQPMLLYSEKIYYADAFKNGFVFQKEVGHATFFYDFEKTIEILPYGYYAVSGYNQNIDHFLKISTEANGGEKHYLLDENFRKTLLLEHPHYCFNNIYIRAKRKTIKAFKDTDLWTVDISNFEGKATKEKDGELMGFENLLFVPLRGGQLLALNAETGEKAWMLEHEIGGQYANFGNKIYKKNEFLYEIDALTGNVIREKNIRLDGSIAVGPIWAYDDIIIIVNILYGDIVLLDRNTFSVKEKLNIGARMPHSKDNIIWHNQKLYVLDMANTLHIYE